MKTISILVLFVLSLATCTIVGQFTTAQQPTLAATWYGGNNQTGAYGVSADVYTPSSAPYLGNANGESSWVSTPNFIVNNHNNWVQTGWYYTSSNVTAIPYTECSAAALYDFDEHGTQNWGAYNNYRVEYYSAVDAWYAAINGTDLVGLYYSDIPDPPIKLLANAEVHEASTTTLYSSFWNVKWMDSTGAWSNFNQNNVWAQSPYSYYVNANYYQFQIYGN